ncbi:MAG TPA: hypothetical protein VMV77_10685 [Bacteroidales bacterium]|nr:hypothetical protein [Bacteroidales bacterium]
MDEVTFWGDVQSNEKVTVWGSWGKEATTIADETGKWQLKLSTLKAGGPYTVTISTKKSSIVLTQVKIFWSKIYKKRLFLGFFHFFKIFII